MIRFLKSANYILYLSLIILSFAPSHAQNVIPNPFERARDNNNWYNIDTDESPILIDQFGIQMRFVPSGCLIMQISSGDTNRVCLDQPYWIDETEVTNEQVELVQSQNSEITFSSSPAFSGGERPRDSVTWFEARDFCEARGARLPTEGEWAYAARGPSNWLYPWSAGPEIFDANYVIYDDTSNGITQPVRQATEGRSWIGAYDMSGNVWEWTASKGTQTNVYNPFAGLDDLVDTSAQRILRGGSYSSPVESIDAIQRFVSEPSTNLRGYGFRCARNLVPTIVRTHPTDSSLEFVRVPTDFNNIETNVSVFNLNSQFSLEPFWIQRIEYISMDNADLPSVNVSPNTAHSTCTAIGGNLPTVEQWLFAAIGHVDIRYVWGNQHDETYYINDRTGNLQTVNVQTIDLSWIGASQMTGNAREWVLNPDENSISPIGMSYLSAIPIDLLDSVAAASQSGIVDVAFRCVMPDNLFNVP